jgi:hypothetical protein
MQTTIGAKRITQLASAIIRAGGTVTFDTAMVMLRATKQATSRTLAWLVRADMLQKIRIPGGAHVWMSTRSLVRTFSPNERPAVYKLSRAADRWAPGATFEHDQLALRVLFSLAPPSCLVTEHEIRTSGTWRNRVPDGVLWVRDRSSGCNKLLELEVETSRKTGALWRPDGSQGGWAKLAERVFRVSHNWPGGGQQTALGMTTGSLLVAPQRYLDSIEKKIIEVHLSRAKDGTIGDPASPDPTIWYYSELSADGSIGPCLLAHC